MLLKKFRLLGFQSFSDSGDIRVQPGINLVIGQNNVGKSSVLRALDFPFKDERHRSEKKWAFAELPAPQIMLQVEYAGEEIRRAMFQRGGAWFSINGAWEHDIPAIRRYLFDDGAKVFNSTRIGGGSSLVENLPVELTTFGRGLENVAFYVPIVNGEMGAELLGQGGNQLPQLLDEIWQHCTFYFSAERLNVGEYRHENVERLLPNAENLAAVLHTLSGSRGDTFKKLVEHVREIFPSTVGNVSVLAMTSKENTDQILIWPTKVQSRSELSFPLKDSGTGVAQVLAILAAVMTIDNAIIIIDEINSFLHPAAMKALLRILQTEYSQHQYIISTHSPDVISYANPSTIYLVKRQGYESSISQVSLDDVAQLRDVADHLGVSMSDVFAAEHVIWVEGPTEELCFPYIYTKFVGPLPKGTLITSVVATGDLGTKDRNREIIFQIYKRLSAAAQPLVKRVAFSFDAEVLTSDQIIDLQRDSGNTIEFLPRRNFECYLIDPHAIADFVNERDLQARDDRDPFISSSTVAKNLIKLAGEQFLIGEWKGDLNDELWLAKIDGAKMITAVVYDLTCQRVRFSKTSDTLAILQNIMRVNPQKLSSLTAYVKKLVDEVGAPAVAV